MSAASAWTPVIYDLRHPPDVARFGLLWREAEIIRAKCIAHRDGQRVEAIGLHIQWGHTAGSLQHWLGVAASATVMVQQDGSILRVIPEEHGPWTQGDVLQPTARASALLRRFGPDPNVYSLTIEAEDARTERINPAQERAICWQIRQWQRAYPQLAGSDWEERIVGHYEINSVEKATCGRYSSPTRRRLASSVPSGSRTRPSRRSPPSSPICWPAASPRASSIRAGNPRKLTSGNDRPLRRRDLPASTGRTHLGVASKTEIAASSARYRSQRRIHTAGHPGGMARHHDLATLSKSANVTRVCFY